MSRPPAWAVVSAGGGLVALVVGWTVGGALQPPGYDPVRQTISALARHGAEHRWIMTTGLGLLGVAYLVTASGLAAVRTAGRLVLCLGGVATLGVTVCAQPAHGSATAHVAFATTGFVLLAIWPATTARASAVEPAPRILRWPYAFAGSAVSIALLAWVGATQGSGPLGLAERLLTAEQALWPLLVVLTLRRSARPEGSAARITP